MFLVRLLVLSVGARCLGRKGGQSMERLWLLVMVSKAVHPSIRSKIPGRVKSDA